MQGQNPGLLDPNDPAAQAFIAGQSMAPVQTAPAENMTPQTPQLPPPVAGPQTPATPPMEESVGGEAAPMLAPSLGTETTGAAATPNALPIDEPEPQHGSIEESAEGDELSQIQNLKMDDVIDPDVLARLKERAMGHGGVRGIVEAITKGLTRGTANTLHPGSGDAMAARDQQDQQDAMHTLTALEGQLNMYKKEALRQRTVRKASEGKQHDVMEKARFEQQAAQVRDTLKQAQTLGVVPPVPPTMEVIQKDPQAATAWIDQTNQIVEAKRTRLDIVSKQIPMFETAIKAGVMEPEKVREAWHGVLASNGVSEQEAKQYWSGVEMMLVSSATQVKRGKDAQITVRNAQAANIGSMIRERGNRSARLDAALKTGDMSKATIELRQITNSKLHAMQELNRIDLDIAEASAKGATPDVIADLQKNRLQIGALQADLENLELYATDSLTKAFNAQRPEIALSDATMEANNALIQSWPEAGQAYASGGLRDFLKQHRDDPRVRAYFQSIANRVTLTQSPKGGQAVTDMVDQQRMKNSTRDAIFGTYMQPTPTAPGAQGGQ